MAGTEESLLINLNSPEGSNLKNNCSEINCNNPFDIVAIKAENWDPFENVLHEALLMSEKNHDTNGDHCKSKKEHVNGIISSPVKVDETSKCEQPKFTRSQSVTDNITFFKSSQSATNDILDCTPKSADDSSPSLRNRIKKLVKRRVSKCIERALNSSLSQPDLRKTEVPSSAKSFFTRNTSGIKNVNNESPELGKNNVERLNKSYCSSDVNKVEKLDENREGRSWLSTSIRNISITGSRQSEPISSTSDEELMSVKPPWEEDDSLLILSDSEDSNDSMGLPKVKLGHRKKKEESSEINAEVIEHYKKRIRASVDGSFDEELASDKTIERTDSKFNINDSAYSEDKQDETDSQKLSKEKIPIDVLPVSIPVLPEVNDLRPKKTGNILKKGPLKAIVPLQKMTKNLVHKMSPLRKSPVVNGKSHKNKQDSSFSSSLIYPPVAASTPNKEPLSQKHTSDTPLALKNGSRLSRKDNEKSSSATRRSVSLTSDVRKTNTKLPFSTINTNVKQNKAVKTPGRPHTAPSNTRQSSIRYSPKSKEVVHRNKSPAPFDKENISLH